MEMKWHPIEDGNMEELNRSMFYGEKQKVLTRVES